jgi:hypothetical protein
MGHRFASGFSFFQVCVTAQQIVMNFGHAAFYLISFFLVSNFARQFSLGDTHDF